MMPSVVVSHAGKQHAYRHAMAVQQANSLKRFVTSSYYKPSIFPDCLLSRFPWTDSRLKRRHFCGLAEQMVSRRWDLELPELLARRVFGSSGLAEHLMYRRDCKFDHWVARRWAARGEIFWGFQGSCLESLRAAKEAGKFAVAEFATAHVTRAIRVLSEEAERHPEWADSISNLNFPGWYRQRLEEEPLRADYCVAASQFTRDSLLEVGIDSQRIKMLPLAADLRHFVPRRRSPSGKFRILFVGGVGQRKGIKYLLEAYRKMQNQQTELVLVGPLSGKGKALQDYRGTFHYRGRLDQAEVVHEMHLSHVLVLPSVLEGFGLVIPEAMATGMPVIASTHSIGPEMIRDGKDGYVLAPDDVHSLAERLDYLASHRTHASEMGQQAACRAQQYTWDVHSRRVAHLLGEIWNPPNNPE